jgi:lipopolysaccharide export system protein LptA
MTPWQRRARLTIAAIGAGVLVLVVLTIRQRPATTGSTEIRRIDPKAVKESSGGVHLPMRGTESASPIAYRHLLEYPDGTTKLIDLRITTVRDGRKFVVTAKEGHTSADRSDNRLQGDVRLTSGDDLKVRTAEATYNQSQKILRAPKRVNFTKGPMSGTSQGMTYEEERELLTLLDRVKVRMAASDGRSPADITSGFAEYARRDGFIRFDKSVRVVRQGQVITARDAIARLSGDEQRLQSLELYGGARIDKPDSPQGGLQSMASEQMNLTYGPDGETLERAVLSGKAAIVEAGSGGRARRIAGDMIDLSLTTDGALDRIAAREKVQLTLPSHGDTPERSVRSASMTGTGGPEGLNAAQFEGGVEFRERRRDSPERIGRSRTLEVAMSPGSGEIEQARFAGGTRFEDGTLRTASADASYDVAKGTMRLTGPQGRSDPRVEDERLTVEALRIDVGFEGPVLQAEGTVRSVLRPERKKGDASHATNGGAKRAVPGMLKDDQPVYVTAARLDYDGGKSLATYTGDARLWQGETTILGHTIVLDETSGNLTAGVDPKAAKPGLVRSAFVLDDRNETTGEVTRVPSTAAGKSLVYEEDARRATYTTEARVTGPQGDVQADRIEMYFVEGGGSLDRAEAYDRVRLKDAQRSATGHRLTYFGQEGRYLMTGTPVQIVRECDETFGKTLTFWRSTDRILVDGNEENRTLTKTGGTCVERRSK